VATNFEGIVARVEESIRPGGAGHLWKLVRTFDDPATWTEPGVRHLTDTGPGRAHVPDAAARRPVGALRPRRRPDRGRNRWTDPELDALRAHLRDVLKAEAARCVPERNQPWPYATRRRAAHPAKTPPRPALALRRLVQRLGMHPEDPQADPTIDRRGRRALVVCTNHGVLDVGKPTGVFASEMTVPYYAFRDAGMVVDVASPAGGDRARSTRSR
jgi:hypothetical protein